MSNFIDNILIQPPAAPPPQSEARLGLGDVMWWVFKAVEEVQRQRYKHYVLWLMIKAALLRLVQQGTDVDATNRLIKSLV